MLFCLLKLPFVLCKVEAIRMSTFQSYLTAAHRFTSAKEMCGNQVTRFDFDEKRENTDDWHLLHLEYLIHLIRLPVAVCHTHILHMSSWMQEMEFHSNPIGNFRYISSHTTFSSSLSFCCSDDFDHAILLMWYVFQFACFLSLFIPGSNRNIFAESNSYFIER